MSVLALTRSRLLEVRPIYYELTASNWLTDLLLPYVGNPDNFWSLAWFGIATGGTEHCGGSRLCSTRVG